MSGCGDNPFTSCQYQADLTGHWLLSLTPTSGDGGIPAPDTIDAQLQQVGRSGLGAFVWGTLTSSDKGAFDTVSIPQLMHNNGDKTGGVLGCRLQINVPIDMPVTDDDQDDDGPLRLSLAGNITGMGMLTGIAGAMIRVDTGSEGAFTWSGVQQ